MMPMGALGPFESLFALLAWIVPGLVLAALFWRILGRAGFDRRLASLALVPALGAFVLLCLLALADWPGPRA